MSKVLVVEDEQDLADEIKEFLEDERYIVETCQDGSSALDVLAVYDYDVIILDWMLPGVDGLAVCRTFRAGGGRTPILMLTAKSSLENKEVGLDTGADDYLTKPFQLKELSARIRALIRRASATLSTNLEAGDIVLNPNTHVVTKSGQIVHLEPKEFNLLEFLMRNKNKTFSADALINRVWESETHTTTDTLRTYIRAIRRKIDTEGQTSIITTVHGVGYKVEAP